MILYQKFQIRKVGVFIPKLKDLTGQTFGKWTVKYRAEDRFDKKVKRECFGIVNVIVETKKMFLQIH